jgi:hypothetical protein
MTDDLHFGTVKIFDPPSSDWLWLAQSFQNYNHLLNHALRRCMISLMNLLQFFTPLQEAFDELADSALRSPSCDRCPRVVLSIALILVRLPLNLSQSRSEM